MISCVWIDCTRTVLAKFKSARSAETRAHVWSELARDLRILSRARPRALCRSSICFDQNNSRSMVCARASAVRLVSERRPCKRRTIDVSWRGRSRIHSAVAAFSSEGRGDLARWRPTRSRTGTSPRKRVRPRGRPIVRVSTSAIGDVVPNSCDADKREVAR